MKYKKFDDLEFKNNSINDNLTHYQAWIEFPNGYGVSVVYGSIFYNKGYEIAILKKGELCYDTPIANDVIQGLTEGQVSFFMKKIQDLPSIYDEDNEEFEIMMNKK